MIYPLSYWKKGDLVVLESSTYYHFRNCIFVYMRVYRAAAVLYCINDGTTVYIDARYLKKPKQ